jgi:hypothetical protein
MFVRDTNGVPLFVMDGDVGRDTSGKPILARTGSEQRSRVLSAHAAAWMTGRKLKSSMGDDGLVMMDLAPGDVVTPSTQAEFPIPCQDFVADTVSQVKLVPHDRGYWYLENVTDAIKVVSPAGADNGGAPVVFNPAYGKTAFTTVGYALAAKLPRDISQNADWDLKLDATRFLTYSLRLAREMRVAALLTTAANWAAGNQVTVSPNKWNGGTAPNPLGNMFSALADSYLPANVMVMAEPVAPYFYANQFQNTATGTLQTSVRDYVQSGGEMPRVLLARAKVQLAGEPSYVWAQALPYNVPVVRAPDSIPTTVTFRWLGQYGTDGDTTSGMLVREYYDERENSDYIVVAHNDIEVFVSNQVGALIVGAMA